MKIANEMSSKLQIDYFCDMFLKKEIDHFGELFKMAFMPPVIAELNSL